MPSDKGNSKPRPKPRSVRRYKALRSVATPRLRKGMTITRGAALRQGATVRQADRTAIRAAKSLGGVKVRASIRKGKIVRKR